MSAALKQQIADAAMAFAEAVIKAVQSPAEWVDQTTCAPMSKRRYLALCAEGALPARKDGRRVLVKRSDMEAYLDKHPRLTREQETGEGSAEQELAKAMGLRPVKKARKR